MLTAGNVVELIPKIMVTAVCEDMDEQSHCAEEDDQFLFGCEPAWCWLSFGAYCGRIHGKRLRADRHCNSSRFLRRRDTVAHRLILWTKWKPIGRHSATRIFLNAAFRSSTCGSMARYSNRSSGSSTTSFRRTGLWFIR